MKLSTVSKKETSFGFFGVHLQKVGCQQQWKMPKIKAKSYNISSKFSMLGTVKLLTKLSTNSGELSTNLCPETQNKILSKIVNKVIDKPAAWDLNIKYR